MIYCHYQDNIIVADSIGLLLPGREKNLSTKTTLREIFDDDTEMWYGQEYIYMEFDFSSKFDFKIYGKWHGIWKWTFFVYDTKVLFKVSRGIMQASSREREINWACKRQQFIK